MCFTRGVRRPARTTSAVPLLSSKMTVGFISGRPRCFRKFLNVITLRRPVKSDLISASVVDVAIHICLLAFQDTMTPL